ncbi:18011_t:CDS:1 [Cetraspora pellucida]|uniref:18011_t:CDS:1 n=1 Tax=Cetraspora pellucida TaxID=1433469 RepID=A0ACA9KAT7_9GLOM|nr:18011_t:CDS:1 [Cetraspora pellucida]
MNQEQLVAVYHKLFEFSNNKAEINKEPERLIDQELSNNTITKEEYRKNHLITLIQNLPNEEVLVAKHLITTMCYPNGFDKGKLLSPYLQKKAHKYITDNFYKHQLSSESIQNTNSKLVLENKRLQCQTKKLIEKIQTLGA